MVWGDQHLETAGFDWKRSVKSIGKYVAYGSGIGLMTWLTVQVRDSKEKRRKEENKRIFNQGHSAAAPDQGDA